jgi:hypothetical protein
MSAFGHKRIFRNVPPMSALPPIAYTEVEPPKFVPRTGVESPFANSYRVLDGERQVELLNLGFGIAGVLSPSLFGFLIDRTGSWEVPFTTSVFLLFVGVLLVFRIDPTRPLEVPSRGR